MVEFYGRLSFVGPVVANILRDQSRRLVQPEDDICRVSRPTIRIENHNSAVLSCDFHPSGKYFISSNRRGAIQFCDIDASFKKLVEFEGHTGAVTQIRCSRDGLETYSASADGSVAIWDNWTGERKTSSPLLRDDGAVNTIQRTNDTLATLCSGSGDGTVRVWDTREQKYVARLGSGSAVNAVCFSKSGNYIFSGGDSNDINIWDMRTHQLLRYFEGHTGSVTGLSVSPCGRFLLSSSSDNTLRIWDAKRGRKELRCFQLNQQDSSSFLRCAWSPCGRLVSAGTADKEVVIFCADSGCRLWELPGHGDTVNDVAFHPKDRVILSASSDQFMFLHSM